jgi:WD40 repeat protein
MTVACWSDWQAIDTAPQLYTGGWAGRWSPDGRWIAILGKERTQIWDATLQRCAWELVKTAPTYEKWGVADLAWRSDSGAVAGGGSHGITAVWELADAAVS